VVRLACADLILGYDSPRFGCRARMFRDGSLRVFRAYGIANGVTHPHRRTRRSPRSCPKTALFPSTPGKTALSD